MEHASPPAVNLLFPYQLHFMRTSLIIPHNKNLPYERDMHDLCGCATQCVQAMSILSYTLNESLSLVGIICGRYIHSSFLCVPSLSIISFCQSIKVTNQLTMSAPLSTPYNTPLLLQAKPIVLRHPSANISPLLNGIGKNCRSKLNRRILDRYESASIFA